MFGSAAGQSHNNNNNYHYYYYYDNSDARGTFNFFKSFSLECE